MSNNYVQKYEDYFRKIVEEHINLRGFCRMDIDEAIGMASTILEYPALVLDTLKTEIIDNHTDNPMLRIYGGFLIVDSCALGDFSAESIIFDKTAQIGIDIIARMNHDQYLCDDPNASGYIPQFEPSTVKSQTYGPILDNGFGTDFSFSFVRPLSLYYNPKKWRNNG